MNLAHVIAAASLCLTACLPNPESVKERRENFSRGSLMGELILDKLPAGTTPIGAVFGERAQLAAYSMKPERPVAGDRVKVSFFWTALKTMDEDYQVFVHGDAISGKEGRIHGDHFPADGEYPTDVWQVGEYVRDDFTVWVPPGYGAPQLGIFVGLYKNDYRVPLSSAGQAPSGSDNRSQAITISFQ